MHIVRPPSTLLIGQNFSLAVDDIFETSKPIGTGISNTYPITASSEKLPVVITMDSVSSSPARQLPTRRLMNSAAPRMLMYITILLLCVTNVSASAASAILPICSSSPTLHSPHVVIIGAGLAGLTCAYELLRESLRGDNSSSSTQSAASASFSSSTSSSYSSSSPSHLRITILESRSRIGGRLLSLADRNLDLGASWHWRHHEEIAKLIKNLGLKSFLDNEKERSGYGARVIGGSQAIAHQLWKSISQRPDVSLKLDAVVKSVHQQSSNQIQIQLQDGTSVIGDFVVVALPPRLAIHSINFTPRLSTSVMVELSQVTTWMGSTTKVVLTFSEPFWLQLGLPDRRLQSEPIYEWHQANSVLETVSKTPTCIYALFGFGGPGVKEADVMKQLQRKYGAKFKLPILSYSFMDWSNEPFTSVTRDDGSGYHPHTEDDLRQSLWSNSHLYFSSTEMAHTNGGFMDGAVIRGQEVATQIKQHLLSTVGDGIKCVKETGIPA